MAKKVLIKHEPSTLYLVRSREWDNVFLFRAKPKKDSDGDFAYHGSDSNGEPNSYLFEFCPEGLEHALGIKVKPGRCVAINVSKVRKTKKR